MSRIARIAFVVALLLAAGRLGARSPAAAGAFGGFAFPFVHDSGEASGGGMWGGFVAVPVSRVVAFELRAGSRRFDTEAAAGPSSTDFSNRQVPISLGPKLTVVSGPAASVYAGAGVVVAPTRVTVTQHYRPTTHANPPTVTEESGTSAGAYTAVGLDVAAGERLLLVLDARASVQSGAARGDSWVGFAELTLAIGYRF